MTKNSRKLKKKNTNRSKTSNKEITRIQKETNFEVDMSEEVTPSDVSIKAQSPTIAEINDSCKSGKSSPSDTDASDSYALSRTNATSFHRHRSYPQDVVVTQTLGENPPELPKSCPGLNPIRSKIFPVVEKTQATAWNDIQTNMRKTTVQETDIVTERSIFEIEYCANQETHFPAKLTQNQTFGLDLRSNAEIETAVIKELIDIVDTTDDSTDEQENGTPSKIHVLASIPAAMESAIISREINNSFKHRKSAQAPVILDKTHRVERVSRKTESEEDDSEQSTPSIDVKFKKPHKINKAASKELASIDKRDNGDKVRNSYYKEADYDQESVETQHPSTRKHKHVSKARHERDEYAKTTKATGHNQGIFNQPCGKVLCTICDETRNCWYNLRLAAKQTPRKLSREDAPVQGDIIPCQACRGKGYTRAKHQHRDKQSVTKRSEESCQLCKRQGHGALFCPFRPDLAVTRIPNIATTDVKCQICKKSGHEASKCQFRHFPTPFASSYHHTRHNSACNYCKNLGHFIRECPVLKRKSEANDKYSTGNTIVLPTSRLEIGQTAHPIRTISVVTDKSGQ